MMPVIPCSITTVSLIPGTAFTTVKNNSLTIFSLSRKSVIHRSSSKRFLLLPLATVRLFPQYRRRCSYHHKNRIHIVSATGTDVAVEEPDSAIANEDSTEASEIPSDAVVVSEEPSPNSDSSPAPTNAKRSRPARKSDMPPVKIEDLIPGASFTGKVKSIQPFGAFIDFGAFTDGLVHVSRLSDNYIKDVGSVVSVGQEVKVKVIEVNTETQRISLSMRESDDSSKLQQRKDAHASTEKAEPGRTNTSKPKSKKDVARKSTKFVKGQDLEGTVKNLTRSGAFISLPDGEEGFLPTSEEDDEGFGSVMGTSSLLVGQEVNVRVLRITRGQVTLTMKKEENLGKLDSQLNQGVVHIATNPFLLAFRENKDIAAFLDEREKKQEAIEKPVVPRTSEDSEGNVRRDDSVSDITEVQDQPAGSNKETNGVPSAVNNTGEDAIADISAKEVDVGTDALTDITDDEKDPESIISSSTSTVNVTAEKEAEVSSGTVAPERDVSTANEKTEEAPPPSDVIESSEKTDSPVEEANEILSPESQTGEDVIQSEASGITAEDKDQLQTHSAENEIPSATPLDSEGLEPNPDKNSSSTKSGLQPDVLPAQETADQTESDGQFISPESNSTKDVESIVNETQEGQIPASTEISSASQVDDKVGAETEKSSSYGDSNGQISVTTSEGSLNKGISPALVKQLREETGAGMMDCKNALS
ncbi:Elongation factor Ts, mitochondrial [Quillaja saponaria]|uniref:Elongation factor Ts, mitochondrial n=1 Tax=Quillaja saponaria TaxID=32244 RepID=A0AAD7M487_QUISA|nr:Elongation factor Ts, mitochondrial [Quillaja saponaria]